jgi:outer membrane beta-barrel protein
MGRLFGALLLVALSVAVPAAARADEDAAAETKKQAEEEKLANVPANLDLDQRIKPVSGNLFLKDGRHEFSPTVDLSLNDAFYSKYVFGLRYAYHLSEKWSVGGNVGWALSTPSGAVTTCDSKGENCKTPTKEQLARTPGDFDLLGGLDVSWAPLYGKISVLAEKVLHFDTYALAGAGVVRTRLAAEGEVDPTSKIAPEVHLGVGQRYFLGRSATLRFEIRDVIYQQEVGGRSDLQNQLLFGVGLSFFLGSTPEA